MVPAGGQRGTKVTVTASGAFTWPVKVSAPGVEAVPTADSGKIEITIPADLPTDRVWVRLYNAEGASATFPFQIDNLPEIAEVEPNNSPKTAQKLPESSFIVNGVLEGADVDSFAVPLKAGQTLVAAVDANTALGSPMDAMLQIVTPNGTVVAENNDDVQLDPRLAYTAPRDGIYIARLFAFPSAPGTSIAFVGGANFVYRMTLTTGPYITHAIPLAVSAPTADKPNEPQTVEVVGWNIPAGTRLPVVALGGERLAGFPEYEPIDELRNSADSRLGIVFAPGFANSARVRIVPHASVPTVMTADAAPLAPSSTVTGWLKTKGQRDVHKVTLQKGQTFVASVESRSLNLLVDPVLLLLDPTGAKVAEVDDIGATQDSAVSHTAAHDGEYKFVVRDRYEQGGDRCAYRLSVRLEQPDFELNLTSDTVTIEPGKPTEVAVKIVRRAGPGGAVGPITIQIPNLPEGVTCPPVVSEPTGPTAAEVKLALTAAGPAFSGPVRVVGTAAQPKELARAARTPARLGATTDVAWLTVIEKKE